MTEYVSTYQSDQYVHKLFSGENNKGTLIL